MKNMQILDTLKRAVRMDSTLYTEIEENEQYNNQAVIICILSALFVSIAANGFDIFGIITSLIFELIGIGIWVTLIVLLAFKLLQVRIIPINFGRCIAIALFPLMLMILMIVPYIGIYLGMIAIILAVISAFFVVREQLEVEPVLAASLSLTGAIPFIIINLYMFYKN